MSEYSNFVHELFLDSCVIIGRLFNHELMHNLCEQILRSKLTKHTSETVKNEIDDIIERRNEILTNLLIAKATGKRKRELDNMIEQVIYPNDKRFLYAVKQHYLDNPSNGEDWIMALESVIDFAEQQLDECFSDEIHSSIISKANDTSALISLNRIMNNQNDSQIFLDMVYEFKDKNQKISLITHDVKDIVKRRVEIQNWFEHYFHQTAFFNILNVIEGSLLVKKV